MPHAPAILSYGPAGRRDRHRFKDAIAVRDPKEGNKAACTKQYEKRTWKKSLPHPMEVRTLNTNKFGSTSLEISSRFCYSQPL